MTSRRTSYGDGCCGCCRRTGSHPAVLFSIFCFLGFSGSVYSAMIQTNSVASSSPDLIATSWSSWSDCSRTCGGGLATRTRRCVDRSVASAKNDNDDSVDRSRCNNGVERRQRVCGSEPCATPVSTSAVCQAAAAAAAAAAPVGGATVAASTTWILVDHPRGGDTVDRRPVVGASCSARCRAVDGRRGGGGWLSDDVVTVKVADGAPCRLMVGSSTDGVCVDGVCRKVGCGGIVAVSGTAPDDANCRSRRDADDGSDSGPFVWHETEFSSCSVTCGTGEESTSVICRDNTTNEQVPDERCKDLDRPETQTRPCHRDSCPFWIAGEWSECSKTCGDGALSTRVNYCVRQASDTDDVESVDADLCAPEEEPSTERPCNQDVPCPGWVAGQWSSCPATCGAGVQSRTVLCRRMTMDYECPPDERPEDHRPCRSKIPCPDDAVDDNPDAARGSMLDLDEASAWFYLGQSNGMHDWRGNDVAENGRDAPPGGDWPPEHTSPELDDGGRQRTTTAPTRSTDDARPYGHRESASDDVQFRRRPVYSRDVQPNGDYHVFERSTPAVGALEKPTSTIDRRDDINFRPRFEAHPWSSCSVTCGTGTRSRRVACIMAGTSQLLPDANCSGPKPSSSEPCVLKSCVDTSMTKFAWLAHGSGDCSQRCAGGIQKVEYACVIKTDSSVVDDGFCAKLPMPSATVQPCNQQPCAPRWRATPIGECSASCNGGEQRRLVECVRQVAWPSTEDVVADTECRAAGTGLYAEPPPSVVLCNAHPCPAGSSDDAERPTNSIEAAAAALEGAIVSEKTNFVQLNPMVNVRLLVGGSATLLEGTNVHVVCSTADAARSSAGRSSHVVWTRNGKPVTRRAKGRLSVDRTGTLRIRKVGRSDVGRYTCALGGGLANFTLGLQTMDQAVEWMQARWKDMGDGADDQRLSEPETGLSGFGELPGKSGTYSTKHLQRMLRASSVAELPVFYVPLSWSACSVRCGLGGGLQHRQVVCSMMGDGWMLDVDESICAKAAASPPRSRPRGGPKLVRPITDRDCGFENCPRWKADDWKECSAKRCVGQELSVRRRRVRCLSPSGQVLEPSRCNAADKPAQREQCAQPRCKAVWKMSNWTECLGACGRQSVRRRNVVCVWSSTGKPASTRPDVDAESRAASSAAPSSSSTPCDVIAPRPPTIKPCRTAPCRRHPTGDDVTSGAMMTSPRRSAST